MRITQAALKKRCITHKGKQVRFFQDLSVKLMRKLKEFDTVRKILVDRKMFRVRVPGQAALSFWLGTSYVQHSGRGGGVH